MPSRVFCCHKACPDICLVRFCVRPCCPSILPLLPCIRGHFPVQVLQPPCFRLPQCEYPAQSHASDLRVRQSRASFHIGGVHGLLPIFEHMHLQGYLSCSLQGAFYFKSQSNPAVPKITSKEIEALRYARQRRLWQLPHLAMDTCHNHPAVNWRTSPMLPMQSLPCAVQ